MMTRIQTRLKTLLAAALFTTAFSVQAQEAPENYIGYPYAFIGLQGGVQETATHTYNNWKLFTPTASVSVGAHFTPVFGARVHVNGIWNKSGYDADWRHIDATYKYKYVTSDLDAMVNVINLFSKNKYRPLNLYLIGGIGLNYAWDNEEVSALKPIITTSNSKARFSHNFRIGGMVDVKVARNWSVNLEIDANSLSDRYNSKISGSDDWQFTAQLGLTYRFGLPHKVKGDPFSDIYVDPATLTSSTVQGQAGTGVNINPEPAPVNQPVVVAVPDSVEEIRNVDIRRDIFYEIREIEVSADQQVKLKEVADWLKKYPEATVSVTGYADKGTGRADSNARYAKQRAESVTKLLTKKYGISASRITTDSKGDIVQPFPTDNDKNRVTIVIANGKEKIKVPKK